MRVRAGKPRSQAATVQPRHHLAQQMLDTVRRIHFTNMPGHGHFPRSQNSTEHLRHCRRSICAAAPPVRGPWTRHVRDIHRCCSPGMPADMSAAQDHLVPIPELHGTSSKRGPRCGPTKSTRIQCCMPVVCVRKRRFLASSEDS